MDALPDLGRIKAILEGDGSAVRQQFVYAGLMLTIFERFKDYVVDRVDEFLSQGFKVRDGTITFTRGEEFKALIKEKGSGDAGQHGNRVFRAALHWLHELKAIEKEELEHVEKLYMLRNVIGHELFSIVADDRKPPIKLMDVVMALSIYVKVTRWWIKEISAAIDPGITQEQYDNAVWDEAESADTMILRLILEKALSGDADWEAVQVALREAV